jgi:hypothetical protein
MRSSTQKYICVDRASGPDIVVIYADSIWIPRTCDPRPQVALPWRIDMSAKQEDWHLAAASKTSDIRHVMFAFIGSVSTSIYGHAHAYGTFISFNDRRWCSECQRTGLHSGRTASIRAFNFECASIAATTNSIPSLTVKHYYTRQHNQPRSPKPTSARTTKPTHKLLKTHPKCPKHSPSSRR